MYKLQRRLENITDKACKEIPWEGTEVDKSQINYKTEELIIGLLKGFGTHCLQTFEITSQGWKHKEYKSYYTREEAIEEFINNEL